MTNKEYNGWFNYETWLVNLWMDNDQGEHEHWREVARESIETNIALCEWYQFEDRLKDYLDQIREGNEAGELNGGLAADLLGAAIGEVNTRDIAKSWIANELEHMEITE